MNLPLRALLIVCQSAILSSALSSCQTAPLIDSPQDLNTSLEINLADQDQDGMPEGWRTLVIRADKTPTLFTPVRSHGMDVIQADANSSASGLHFSLNLDAVRHPWINWYWKIENQIKSADITQRSTEDAPVRLVLGFAGDKSKLPFKEQMLLNMAKVLSGNEIPYATLIYLWENHQPVNTVITHSLSERIKMIVAESGTDKIGEWQYYSRNYAADFEQAYGEKPGNLISISIITDTDNTQEQVRAWYGPLSIGNSPRQ